MLKNKMIKNITFFFLVLLLVIGIFVNVAAAQQYNFSLGHVGSVDTDRHLAALEVKKVLEEKTNGQATITIFPSGQLGDWPEMIEGLQMRTIDIVIESIGSLSPHDPIVGIESMPYLFKDMEDYLKVWYGPIGQEIINKVANEANYLCIGHLARGARQLTANKPIEKLEDLQGFKMRVSPMKERIVTWTVLGASPTPMGWTEVFTALDQGVIDGQENPLDTIYNDSIYEVQDYLILTSHMISGFTFMFNNNYFNSLPENIQQALREAIKAGETFFNERVVKEDERLLELLKKEGMIVISPDLEPWRERTKKVVDEFPDLKPWYDKITG